MGIFLIILQIIGAMPAIIDLIRRIYDMINGIQDRSVRREMRLRLRRAVFRWRNVGTMSADDETVMRNELTELHRDVLKQLDKELRRA